MGETGEYPTHGWPVSLLWATFDEGIQHVQAPCFKEMSKSTQTAVDNPLQPLTPLWVKVENSHGRNRIAYRSGPFLCFTDAGLVVASYLTW